VARNSKTKKAYKVPEMNVSPYDDLASTRKSFEIGLTIKDWSREKGQRDMQSELPSHAESYHYQDYLKNIEKKARLNPEQVVTMDSTLKSTRILMHGQDKNRHGKMFGGYLMKEAFDISWVAATSQYPSGVPELLRVDQVLFLSPVPVGSIMDFKSKVTLIEGMKGLGRVMRVVTKAYNEFGKQTNNFNFLFVVRGDEEWRRYVLPETFEDILEYHEAKRRLWFERIITDTTGKPILHREAAAKKLS
jgi:acyl-coenzyme A thioesterase 9